MADFRRWILALTVLALCVAGANAQIVGSGTGASFTCTASNGAVTPTVRSEGITELVGDIVIQCTGGNVLAPGSQIPQANITVFLNTQVTSRLLGSGSVASASEAVLFIDEPNSGDAGYGPTVPITICPTPGSGCVEYVGTATSTDSAAVSPNCNGAQCTGVPVNTVSATAQAPAPNTFQGVVNPDGKSVTFFGVPIMPPASTGLVREFRITNVRANASAIPAGANTPGNVQALISISGSSYVPLTNSQLVVGYVVAGLTASTQNFGNSGSLSSSGTGFNQCSSQNGSSGGTGVPVGILRYHSNFGTAFKTRVLAGTNGNSGQNGTAAVQNIPGSANNAVSESGFIFNGAPQANAGGSTSDSLSGNGNTAGLADFGTRFQAVFNNIPAGVSIYVSTTNVSTITQNAGTVPAQPAATSTASSYAQLIVSATSPENGGAAPFLSATGSNGANGLGVVPIQINGNTGTAVWEVVNSNTSTNQNFDFGVYLSYSANVAAGTPTAPSTITVSMSYAPISSTFTASALPNNVPRFIDLGTGDNKSIANFAICTTNLLFPYVTTVTGFETGLAISNTTIDPFGTGPQAGACTLYWYGNNAGGTTNTPIANSSSASFPGSAATIAAGTTWTALASDSHMAGQGFTGYMIATCNFQYAHGYAAITDVGTRGILTAYLALVMSGGRVGTATETLTH